MGVRVAFRNPADDRPRRFAGDASGDRLRSETVTMLRGDDSSPVAPGPQRKGRILVGGLRRIQNAPTHQFPCRASKTLLVPCPPGPDLLKCGGLPQIHQSTDQDVQRRRFGTRLQIEYFPVHDHGGPISSSTMAILKLAQSRSHHPALIDTNETVPVLSMERAMPGAPGKAVALEDRRDVRFEAGNGVPFIPDGGSERQERPKKPSSHFRKIPALNLCGERLRRGSVPMPRTPHSRTFSSCGGELMGPPCRPPRAGRAAPWEVRRGENVFVSHPPRSSSAVAGSFSWVLRRTAKKFVTILFKCRMVNLFQNS